MVARRQLRARALVLGLACALLTTAAVASPAGAERLAGSRDPSGLRGRAGQLIADGLAKPAVAGSARARPAGAPAPARASRPPMAEASAMASCAPDALWVNTLTDRSVVHARYAGAASISVLRQRDFGAWTTVRTSTVAAFSIKDMTINPRVSYAYRMIAKNASGTVLTDCATSGVYGTWTDDGWGDPDAVVSGDAGMFQQGRHAQGDRVALGSWITPAYSADGRLYAATRITSSTTGTAVMEVRRSGTSALVFTVDLGAAAAPADPDFSPDGQTLAFSRYDVETGDALPGLGFVDVHGSHTTKFVTTSRAVAEPAWRPDGSSLVVSTFGTGAGLATVCSTCSTVTPMAGTTGGYTPEVGPDGSVWFTTDDGTTSALRKRLPSGSVSVVRSSTTDSFTSPRLTPDGTVYVERDTPDETDPSAYSMVVWEVAATGVADDDVTALGWEVQASGITGWDVRQPQSKGSSDFAGTAHHDVVARDGSGILWAYRNTGWELSGRTQIGSGWNGYTIVAGGDLNSDDRADLVARDSSGRLYLYRGQASGGLAARTQIGSGWNGYLLIGVGDWSGDDLADLLARDSAGTLWLYPGTGRGTVGARRSVGGGWNGMNAIVGGGDIDFDNKADLMARDTSGRLWVYPGNGSGGLLPRRQIGTGWGAFTALTATEVTNQRPLVWARRSTGELVSYELRGDGVFSPGDVYSNGKGWNAMTITS